MRLTQILRKWREASTLMICARSSAVKPAKTAVPVHSAPKSASSDFDYQLLMLERSGKSSFFPSAYVFPGGGISSSDHSESWLPLLSKSGSLDYRNLIIPESSPQRSPMFTKKRDWALPSEVAFRICAIRETFEEAGLLLCKYIKDGIQYTITDERNIDDTSLMELLQNVDVLNKWRKAIHNDASQFLKFCGSFSLIPDIWSLQEWSNWLTPTNMDEMHGGRRYDTAFYICSLESQPDSLHDNKEIIASNWHEPEELLKEFFSERHWLAPPQVYELQRLCNFRELENLTQFAKQRQTSGCVRWMPVRNTFRDGIIAVLPGDELYPEEPDYKGELPPVEWPQTMAESTRSCQRANRMELTGPFNCRISCNIPQPVGHAPLYPIDHLLS